ncbi:hypothetical protein FQR65_LT03877 [Abscondita terminalis]|nr:hypothetical protein FQR65_LT03877 [Abscondita terminalis]
MSNQNVFSDLNASSSTSEYSNNSTLVNQQLRNPTTDNAFGNESETDITLKSVNVISQEYREIFSNYDYFNKIQSEVLDSVLYTDKSIAVSAPTGSGKTVIFELAVVRFMQRLKEFDQQTPYKIVYVAPLKALCEERLADWLPKFAKLGLKCISVTGDTDFFDFQRLVNYNFIITTPEKWDSLTRRWRDNKNFVAFIKLFMIDEVHLLNDNQRGPTVEVIVSRMKTIQDCTVDMDYGFESLNLRFVAVSATIPNVADIGEWLSTPQVKAQSFKFNEDMRPVKLKKVVIGYNSIAPTPFKFDIMLNYKLQSVMLKYAEGKPTLIFCSTRKNVEMTSRHLSQNLTINLNSAQQQVLRETCQSLSETKLKDTLVHGIGFHHAGLSQEDRKIMEDLFRKSGLPILVTTSTLAMGINLPAHLVIIKSTKHYCNGEYRDYSESMMLQMVGRAGRPQFDTSATAVILTTASDKHKFENMVGDLHPVESNLHKHLTEHLNAEVVLNTIIEFGDAVQWITTTYLYIRAGKDPKHYGIPSGLTLPEIDKKLLEMCLIQIHKLARTGMLIIDQNDGQVKPTKLGIIMAKYYVALDTMKLFAQVTGTETLSQILSLISKCEEFSEMHLRVNDKKTLNLLNKSREKETIRFPFKGAIKTVDMKINCLIQAVLGCLPMLESSLVNESLKIMRVGERIANCSLAECLSTRRNCYSALLNTLILAKCFHVKLWENSPYVSRQLSGISPAYSTALADAGKTNFKSILESNPKQLEMIINRKPTLGNLIQDEVEHLPQYELEIKQLNKSSNITMEIKVHLRNAESVKLKSSVDGDSTMSLLIGDSNNNIILLDHVKHNEFIEIPTLCKTFTIPDMHNQVLQAHFISADWVGIDCETSFGSSHINDVIKSNVTQIEKKISKKAEPRAKTPHVQMLVDSYFKHLKVSDTGKTTKDVRHKRKSSDEIVISNSMCTHNNRQESRDGKQVLEINAKNSTNSSILSNLLKECAEEYQDIHNLTRNTCSPLNCNNSGDVSHTQNSTNQYRLLNHTSYTVNVDNLLSTQLNDQNKNQEIMFANYKCQPIKNFKSTISASKTKNLMQSSKKIKLLSDDDDSSSSGVEEYMATLPLKPEDFGTSSDTQKTISWSSPLVVPNSTKYSPILEKTNSVRNTNLISTYNNKASASSRSQAFSECGSLFTQASTIRPSLTNNLQNTVYDYPLSDKKFYRQNKQSANGTSLNLRSPTFHPTSNPRQQQNSKKPTSVADYYLKTLSNSISDHEVFETISKTTRNVETQTFDVSIKTTQDASTSPIKFDVGEQTSILFNEPMQTSSSFEFSENFCTNPRNTPESVSRFNDSIYKKPQLFNSNHKISEPESRRPQNCKSFQPSIKHYFYPNRDSSHQPKSNVRCCNPNYQISQRFGNKMYCQPDHYQIRDDGIDSSFCGGNLPEVSHMQFPRRKMKRHTLGSQVLKPNNFDWRPYQRPQTHNQYRVPYNFNKPGSSRLNINNDLMSMQYVKPTNHDNVEYGQYFPWRPVAPELDSFEDSYEK